VPCTVIIACPPPHALSAAAPASAIAGKTITLFICLTSHPLIGLRGTRPEDYCVSPAPVIGSLCGAAVAPVRRASTSPMAGSWLVGSGSGRWAWIW
jgi:hypothetical protein